MPIPGDTAALQLTHPHASVTWGIITITDLNTQLTLGSIKNKKSSTVISPYSIPSLILFFMEIQVSDLYHFPSALNNFFRRLLQHRSAGDELSHFLFV